MPIILIQRPDIGAHSLRSCLPTEHGGVERTSSLAGALRMAGEGHLAAFVLDLRRFGLDAAAAVRELRKHDELAPIVLLCDRASLEERIRLMEAGADECLAEPLSEKELSVRLRILLRRAARLQEKLCLGDLELDLMRRRATRQGKPIPLTTREFAVLECLLRHAGQPLSRTRIFEQVWNRESAAATTNIVDVYINYLRAKVDRDFEPKLIHTVYGLGYMLAANLEHSA